MLGGVIYEILVGHQPFYSEDHEKFAEAIKDGALTFPDKIDQSTRILIMSLLYRDPGKRCGSQLGVEEVKELEFFSKINTADLWSDIEEGLIKTEKPFEQVEINQDQVDAA